uniref:Rad51 domain-containing protein n=1 Tax=Strongyloides stercoralis TaxID=6248 RepID=A0A0K0DTA7_STRER
METLLQVCLRLGSDQFTHKFGIPEFDNLFENGIKCTEVSELVSEESCGETYFCYHLLATFLEDPTKIYDRIIYVDTNKTFRIEKVIELIKNENSKSDENLSRIIVKKIISIDELYNMIIGLPNFLKYTRVSLMVINSIYGCILSQELIANDYTSSIERILFGLKKLAKQEGIAILTINALVMPNNSSEPVPLLGVKWLKHIPKRVSLHQDVYKWLKHIPKRVSLHQDVYISNMVKKKVFYSKKYEHGKLIHTNNVVRYLKTERGIEIYKL